MLSPILVDQSYFKQVLLEVKGNKRTVLFKDTETRRQRYPLVYRLNVCFLFGNGKKIQCAENAVILFHCFLQFVPI